MIIMVFNDINALIRLLCGFKRNYNDF